ncbi:unnamed protein product [Arabidopsis arenosa]|uniref:Uncharacterized protein n=1 Tax=Arabidopsis arenosa TaxID=38785 RepID=A0A8S2AVG8_ARAAE|nr:unnamed protein product [Arabidopsis arenosa]
MNAWLLSSPSENAESSALQQPSGLQQSSDTLHDFTSTTTVSTQHQDHAPKTTPTDDFTQLIESNDTPAELTESNETASGLTTPASPTQRGMRHYARIIAESFGGKPQPWLLDRMMAGALESIYYFVNGANAINKRTVVHRVIDNPSITVSNHKYLDDEEEEE